MLTPFSTKKIASTFPKLVPGGMDLWSLYGRYRENGGGDENGFRTDEAENQGIAVDACRKGAWLRGCRPNGEWCMIQ